jgi:glycosyltransferase involved in cell wall biosynthesis
LLECGEQNGGWNNIAKRASREVDRFSKKAAADRENERGALMNIWLIHHHAIPPTEPGSTRHHSIARHLRARGHDVSIVCSAISHHTRTDVLAANPARRQISLHDGVRFLRLRSVPYSKNDIRRIFNFLSFSARLRLRELSDLPRPDVILGSSPQPLSALMALAMARRLNLPFVLEIRDLWPETLCELGGYSRRNPAIALLYTIERILYTKSDAIITLLPSSVDYISSRGAARDKIVHIPNGIDLEQAPYVPSQVSSDKFVVMYVGAHGLANGLEEIVKAIAKLRELNPKRNIVFRFIGSGPHKPSLRQLAQSLSLTNLHFEDAVPKEQIFARMAEADAFILNVKDSPLYRHGISLNKAFDYLAMGRPTVFAGNAPNNIFAAANAGISVAADDVEGMARAVLALSEMGPEERAAMGKRGRDYVAAHNDYRELARSVETVLARVVAPSQAARSADPFYPRTS